MINHVATKGQNEKRGYASPFSFVEMAGIEPASRTLLKSATTLIFGCWSSLPTTQPTAVRKLSQLRIRQVR